MMNKVSFSQFCSIFPTLKGLNINKTIQSMNRLTTLKGLNINKTKLTTMLSPTLKGLNISILHRFPHF